MCSIYCLFLLKQTQKFITIVNGDNSTIMNDSFKVTDSIPLVHTPVPKIVQYQIVTGGLIDCPEHR